LKTELSPPISILGIIPARYHSTRFLGKALVDIAGISMIQRVWEKACQSQFLAKVIIATDDERIFTHAQSFGAEVVMTSSKHLSGTDRCYEALKKTKGKFDYVINIQGDEPFIQPQQIDILAELCNKKIQIATLVKRIEDEETLFSPNTPKVILDDYSNALYFSRQTVPYLRGIAKAKWLHTHDYFKHIGIYAYRTDVLKKICKLPPALLEKVEGLEQLRWLANGIKIKVAETPYDSHGIDTPEDLEWALAKFTQLKTI
jgi:3-deoxy-manno-octulosonate cytidylyltransferase (CMP-KDO synthetase)